MREVIDGLFAKFGTTLGTETEPREELILPEPARTLWLATHAIIERTFAQTGGCRLGGGTLLSARWKHRVSLDIDVTIEPKGRQPQRIEHWPPVDPGRAVAGWAPAERKWLAELVAAVRARHAEVVHNVIVYGSKARGDWNDDSDIDMLIIVADGAAERREALRHLAYDLSVTAEALPTILPRTESEWRQLGEEDSPFRRGIECDGFSVW